MADKVFLTKAGKEELERQLQELREKSVEATEKVKVAREFGDLSENFEYHVANEEQGKIAGQILELEDKLKRAEIIEEGTRKKGTVSLGSIVEISVNGGAVEKYEIVGTVEAKIYEGKISNESPIGNAILGKKVGEEVFAITPNGKRSIKIISIA